MENIDIPVLEIALEKCNGTDFEQFINSFASSIFGYNFIPLGGSKDGGADAFNDIIYEIKEKSNFFVQSSIIDDYKSKINNTLKRLQEFGRDVACLYFFTPNEIKHIDVIEDELSEVHNTIIKIRSRTWIISKINANQSTKDAFHTHIAKYTYFLKKIGSPSIARNVNAKIPDEIILFLSKEIDDTDNEDKILFKLCDGLILWSLEGTDPDQSILMSEEELTNKIFVSIPQIEPIIKNIISERLVTLRKAPKKERQIRYHSNVEKYCLTYDIRKHIEEENIRDEKIINDVKQIFKDRIYMTNNTLNQTEIDLGSEICLKTIQKMFEQEGYKLSIAISNEADIESPQIVSDILDEFICKENKDITVDPYNFKKALIENIRCAFYESSQEERDLFRRYSILYTLLFTINTDPKVLEYFQNMTTELNLFIGSDVLIRALSERYLSEENQTTRNTLKIIIESGGNIILSQPIYEEVYYHLRNTNYEFLNHYSVFDESGDLIVLENADRILIRSYAYAKKKNKKLNWERYINSFCDFQNLLHDKAYDELKSYLLGQFKLIFEPKEKLTKYCDEEELLDLKNKLLEWKDNENLALNDALMALSIYGKRLENNEYSVQKEFGYSTWWFTGESYILKFTKELVNKMRSRYMMRPEFILKYMTFSMNYNEARKIYNNVFPSIMGIKLVRRVDQKILEDLTKEAEKLKDMEEGRKIARAHELSNRLKSDFRKRYNFHRRESTCD